MDDSKCCRTCLNNNNNSFEMLSIYDCIDELLLPDVDYNNDPFSSTTKQTISEMLEAITGNKIITSSGSVLPTKICMKCTDNMKISFAFQHQCKRSFEILTTMLKDKSLTTPLIEIDNSNFHNINTTGVLEDNTQMNQQTFCDDTIDADLKAAEIKTENHKQIQTDEHLFYECEMCDYKFFDEFSLRHHRAAHPDIKCLICKKTFLCVKSLRTHVYGCHKKSYNTGAKRECKACKKAFGTNNSFIHHIKVFENCGKNLENIRNAKRITDATIIRQNKIRVNEEQFDIRVVQQNSKGKWECKTCGKLYNKEKKLRKHICGKPEIETETSTLARTLVPNNDDPSIILKNASSMAIKSSTRVTRSATGKSTTVMSDVMNSAIKEEILSDNDVGEEDLTPFEIIFTNELNSICNIKIENKNIDDAYNKNDLNLNIDGGVVSADDAIDNYDNDDKDFNPSIKKQIQKTNNNSNCSNDFDVGDTYNSDDDVDEDDDDNNENLAVMKLKKKIIVKNSKHNDELIAEVQQPSYSGEAGIRSTTSNYDSNEPSTTSITVKNNIESKSIRKKSASQLQIKKLSTKIKISCDLCKWKFVDFEAFTRHKELHKNIKANSKSQCSICNAVFGNTSSLNKHMYSHNNERPFVCTICKKTFKSPHCLESHKQLHDEKRLTCTICNKKFNSSYGLTTHKKREHKECSYACDICSSLFVSFSNIKRHMNRHTHTTTHSQQYAKTQAKQYECKLCNERFKSYKEKRRHLRSHRKGQTLQLCPQCGKSFQSSSNYIVHMRRHDGVNPFPCKFCDKAFPRMSDLRAHERHHTDFRPHKCSVCDKAFTRASNLLIHTRTHTGERPYKCTYCPSAYAQTNDLKTHIRRHTGERFKCNICDAAFIQNHLLSRHKRNVHGMTVPTMNKRLEKISTAK